MSGQAQQLWNRLRGTVRESLTFSEIKDVAGSAGLSLERLANLQQRQMPGRSNSKTELLDEIGVLVAEVDESEKREVILEFVRKCIEKHPERQDQILQHAKKVGFSLDLSPIGGDRFFLSRDSRTVVPTRDHIAVSEASIAPFISYAHEDRDLAGRLYHDLASAGTNPWLDAEKLLGGQDWQAAIRKAIHEATHFIALISEHSVNKRGFVQKELRHALEVLAEFPPNQIFVIPVRLDSSDSQDEQLRRLHRIDLFPDYRKGLKRLYDSLGIASDLSIAKPAITAAVKVGQTDSLVDVISEIRARVAKQFPDDFSTQKFVIENETKAYHEFNQFSAAGVPGDVISRILKNVTQQFPDDFSTRVFVANNQVAAWQELQIFRDAEIPDTIFQRIAAKAVRDFPDDFETRLFVMRDEIGAWKDLNK
jgi:hypothetical protein